MDFFYKVNKILFLLTKREKYKLILLSIILFFSGILELLSLSVVVYLISLITKNKRKQQFTTSSSKNH